MTTVGWLAAAAQIEDRFWPRPAASAAFSPSWWALNEAALHAEPLYLVVEEGDARAMAPFLIASAATYESFVPVRLLTALLEQPAGPVDTAAAADDAAALAGLAGMPPDALVCAVPLGFETPLRGTPPALTARVAELAEREAVRRGLPMVAFLYLEDRDAAAAAMLAERGYVTTVLDASAVIDIDAGWGDLDGYFHATRRGRNLRWEHRRFVDAGYRVTWHRGGSERVIAAAARLEAELLQRKGHDFSVDELHAWYTDVVRGLGARALFVTASVAPDAVSDAAPDDPTAAPIDAFVLFLDDGARLVAKTGGFVRRDFLYFNVFFYEPIRYALAHGVRELEYGLAAGAAKRARGARGRRLTAALWTPDGRLAAGWPRIAGALARRYQASWGAADDPIAGMSR